MNDCVLKFIFLFVIKDHAFAIDKVQDGDLPQGTHEELNHEVVHPFLNWIKKYVLVFGLLLIFFRFLLWFLLLFTEKPL